MGVTKPLSLTQHDARTIEEETNGMDEARRLERAARTAWPPEEEIGDDGWALRFNQDVTHRGNSVLAVERPRGDLEARIDRAERFYRERGLGACFQVTPFSRPEGLDAALERRGYRIESPSEVWLRPHAEPWPGPGGAAVEARTRAWPDWTGAALADDDEAAVRRATLDRIAVPARFALARSGGEALGAGYAVLAEGSVGVFGMHVRTEARGRGIGGAILADLLAWGREAGARDGFLLVESGNAPAQALYRRAGFGFLHPYWYRRQGTED
ncbi:GNAT family N-acetyltransferase [Marinivivus vitaminiproducens]|uniref:GNAT family N-acetyltransferase n=1 Tax=Marinivivus vitaminiproducens TaxID=3035935 RepID=UPI0027A88913|nr:GNAT family N-acetyltransferase [Geminicoccaceae bacterium SCSIO 64248]